MKTQPDISGVLPVLQMPYHEDDTIDFDVLAREVDHVIAAGSDGARSAADAPHAPSPLAIGRGDNRFSCGRVSS